ncbi:hypothetical protein [Enterococcus nangangensis]|uniref:hypothetical protein n=1 Tax=Enterococcus nangangensis TaxID=2559926 RepID=UPI0014856785|nr:hypothetical protein [Enterococcus nangangensis]
MLKGKTQIVFRVGIGLVMLIASIKYFDSSEYLIAAITALAGVAFIVSVLFKRKGKKE